MILCAGAGDVTHLDLLVALFDQGVNLTFDFGHVGRMLRVLEYIVARAIECCQEQVLVWIVGMYQQRRLKS
ncbi:MAG: hypothetical protein BGO50_09885 [Rhodanobacter sp. 67-28]|nr:MAG: hypothetical protein BGO50_09885 [Rhodanobacter sp. 67-28]